MTIEFVLKVSQLVLNANDSENKFQTLIKIFHLHFTSQKNNKFIVLQKNRSNLLKRHGLLVINLR